MNIGIYNPYLDSLSGGERYVLTIASCLSDQHKVTVFWDDASILKKAQERLSIDLKHVSVAPNIFSRKIPLFSSYAKTSRYDLIIVLSDGSIPFIHSKSGIIHFQRPFAQVNGRSLVNRIKLHNYQKVITNSHFTKHYIDTEFNVRSQLIYPPVGIEKFIPSKKEHVIISVGRFHPFKKQSVLIKSFIKLSDELKGWRLVLAGGLLTEDRKYFSELKNQARNYPITFSENIDFVTLKKYIERAEIYWHAAGYGEDEKAHPENFEHFGITPVEAMAAGCVPIVFNGGGLPEIITNGEHGYLWNSPQELLRHTKMVIKNSELRKKIVSRNAKHILKFSTGRFCDEVHTLVQSLHKNT